MKFGQVPDPSLISFKLPVTHPKTFDVLQQTQNSETPFEVYVGCAKWNKNDLKGFYPKGVKDELTYYAMQFNSIELNATFYQSPSVNQVITWRDKVPTDFKFFPKIPQSISHYNRLQNVNETVLNFTNAIANFENKLGMSFLQMHENFKPKDVNRLADFLYQFPTQIPLAVEVRNEEWFADANIFNSFTNLLQQYNATNIIVDTAGRRDMLHMLLTTDTAFVRYVGANHPSDYDRLNDWIDLLVTWRKAGLNKLYFFIHQNIEVESPLLATHFIQRLNAAFGLHLRFPEKQLSLF
ncbi:DUF72 domain-containing protein [Flavobacterium agricola]|uniref:DUF72 domain-containing protein n=1 Tax=Flavobacterium agricola TaxID=2870839 RepID=A0ABY6M5B0_9FLAO|nr:DUF72 domain-containing protein [Flavobacterium agricola]UYW02528.1 DUF72 domain-containing protein [Flavobacterium agricola]